MRRLFVSSVVGLVLSATPGIVRGQVECPIGFADCDGVDGCETPTNIAQTGVPASYGPGAVKAGYQQGFISNCGACGQTCNDGDACTTDLCVPVAGVGTCRHYHRSQCAERRCDDLTPAEGTPAIPSDPGCSGDFDADDDGINARQETPQSNPYTLALNPGAGKDVDCDGEISHADGDLVWHEQPLGDATKDVYVEFDYMFDAAGGSGAACVNDDGCLTEPFERCVGGFCRHSHEPYAAAVTEVQSRFDAAGIKLHVDPVHEQLAETPLLYFPTVGLDNCAVQPGSVAFHDPAYKSGHQHPARRYGYHYFIFAHGSCSESSEDTAVVDGSGVAEILGQDGIVSTGVLDYAEKGAGLLIKQRREQAGTFMHGLGHNLGLCHEGVHGADSDPCPSFGELQRANHISSMNQSFQLAHIARAADAGTTAPLDPSLPRRVDFSSVQLADLDESALDETVGINITTSPFDRDITRYRCPSVHSLLSPWGPGFGAIDWNCQGDANETGVAEDINASGIFQALTGNTLEWQSLDLRFECQPGLADGVQSPQRISQDELSASRADAENLRASSVDDSSPDSAPTIVLDPQPFAPDLLPPPGVGRFRVGILGTVARPAHDLAGVVIGGGDGINPQLIDIDDDGLLDLLVEVLMSSTNITSTTTKILGGASYFDESLYGETAVTVAPFALRYRGTLQNVNQARDPDVCPNGAPRCQTGLAGAEVRVFRLSGAGTAAAALPSKWDGAASDPSHESSCVADELGICDAALPAADGYEVIARWADQESNVVVCALRSIGADAFSAVVVDVLDEVSVIYKKDGSVKVQPSRTQFVVGP